MLKKLKMLKTLTPDFLVIFLTFLTFLTNVSFAQGDQEIIRKIINCGDKDNCCFELDALKELDFRNNNYVRFIDTLKDLSQKKKALEHCCAYYSALARYEQLKYLEVSQSWEEYFSKGDEYRKELAENLQKAIDGTSPDEKVRVYSRLLQWQFFKDQQNQNEETALKELVSDVMAYSKTSTDLDTLKYVGDKLLSQGYRGKSKEIYRVYVERLVTSNIDDARFYEIASGFFKEGNLELAEIIYDIYIERILKALPKDQAVPILIKIAREFTYKDEGLNDPAYAEKIFKMIEEISGREAFDRELAYLRAFNLEKSKDYPGARDAYLTFIQDYPDSAKYDEAVFKLGIMSAYVFRDAAAAENYFDSLALSQMINSYTISALYQLGLLSQWQADLVKAREYYNALIEKSRGDMIFDKESDLARERLKEIENSGPLNYNLNLLLDVSLKEEYALLDMETSTLKSSLSKVKTSVPVSLNLDTYKQEGGCTPVALQYVWSGDTGIMPPGPDSASFSTSYLTTGTKLIGVVIVGPSGVIGKNIDMIDVE